MKHLQITTIAAVLLVGCGEAQQSAPAPEAKPVEPVAEAAKPEPTGVKAPDNLIRKAVRDGNIEAVKQYLDAGTDVNAKDENGVTPLHQAAFYGQKEVVELLIAKGADVNAKEEDGWTPLHFAAMEGHTKVAELLITAGADVNAKFYDETPLDWAIKRKQTGTADLLRKHGGKTGEELALMPRLKYGKNRWPFDFSVTAKGGMTYVVEVTQDFKQWGELETIEGTGKQVKFIDPRQPKMPFKRNFYRVKLVE